ncbi:hypothetical protein CR47_0206660 [Ralstonia solanacearum]|nr:hypothetical protein RSUY_44660 [Ralstonia solanacearum]ATI30198.1 hypothetical protein CCY86_22455 [Ralstonia solanacearum]ATJ88938.1 hypothetical protein CDC59_22330 [Ralstonia solanacearum]KFX77980.1 hypothetical protein KR98_16210 [Ralstonia solanacearum]KFX81464.1 hypothetical protein KR99_23020 [Ralstonia solanacearum]
MRQIKVMVDYQCHPLWEISPGLYGEIDPNALPISMGLKQKLADWAAEFDETLDMTNPANSGFKSVEVESAFKARGIKLAEQLQNELGRDFIVSVKV